MKGVARLNVGGKRFCTTSSTLSARGENFLTRMLAHHEAGTLPSTVDENGYLFIDRSPSAFEVILDYLRTGCLHTRPDVPTSLLSTELDFYGIAHTGSVQYEYKTLTHHVCLGHTQHTQVDLDDAKLSLLINELAAEGWRLVNVTSSSPFVERFVSADFSLVHYFERLKLK